MSRWGLLALASFMLACLPARAVEIYGCYNGSAQQGGHRLTTNGIQSSQYAQQSYPATTVTVFNHGTVIPATIFSDASGTPLANPFTSSSTGVAFWCAADGKYDVQYSGTTITAPFSVSDIPVCFSCTGGSGGGGGSGTVGPGTVNHLLRFNTPDTAGDSVCTDDGITPMACSLGINLVTNALYIQKQNNASTGTTVNLLVSRDTNGFAINAQVTDTNNLIGIAGFGAGTTGNVSIAYVGQFACQFDNQTAISDWVVLGANSQCHDAGSVEPTATQNVGRIATINSGAGTLAVVELGLPDVTSASSGGGGGNGTVGNCNTPGSNAYYNVAGNTVECDNLFLDNAAGGFTATSGTFTGPDSGFVAMVQGTAPAIVDTNAAYWHAPLLVANSFDTAVPSTPGTAGQVLAIDTAPDGTHITTKWTSVTGVGTVTSSGPPTANRIAYFTTADNIAGVAADATTTHALFATAGVPAFRAIAGSDIPTLNQSTTGTASNLSGTPALPNGTTGTTQAPGDNTTKLATDAFVLANAACATCVTSAAALTNHGVVVGNGLQASAAIAADTNTTHFLAATATDPAFRAIIAGDIPTLNQNTSGTAANLSGTPTVPNGTAATTQALGDNTTKIATDAFVLANSGLSGSGTIYYVSNAGNNAAAGTSTTTPWQTVAKVNATSFNPGDTILFNRGDTWAEFLDAPSSGTNGHNITFGAYGVGANPTITGSGARSFAMRITGKGFITVQNLTFTGATTVGLDIESGSHDILVQDSVAHDNGWQGFACSANGGPASSNCLFQRLTAYLNLTYAGIFMDATGYAIIQDSVSYSNGTDNFRDHGFYVMGHTGTIVRRSIAFSNAAHGFKFGSTTDGGVFAYDISYNNGRGGFWTDDGSTGGSLYNSVSYHDLWGIVAYNCGLGATWAVIKNVIVRSSTAYGVDTNECSGGGTITSFTNNDVNGSATADYIGIASQTGSNGNISADPLFASESLFAFGLSTGSPAIDTGANLGDAYRFTAPQASTQFPPWTLADQGAAGSGWEMGAFIYAPEEPSNLTRTIASGAKALATGAIGSAACTAAQTDTATGTLTTDTISATFNGDPTAVTGYVPLTTGMLTVIVYPTANTVNFKVCNNTASSITPGAITLNWRVMR